MAGSDCSHTSRASLRPRRQAGPSFAQNQPADQIPRCSMLLVTFQNILERYGSF